MNIQKMKAGISGILFMLAGLLGSAQAEAAPTDTINWIEPPYYPGYPEYNAYQRCTVSGGLGSYGITCSYDSWYQQSASVQLGPYAFQLSHVLFQNRTTNGQNTSLTRPVCARGSTATSTIYCWQITRHSFSYLGTKQDGDLDFIADDYDNCPAASNQNQTDIDGDGLGNACDPTSDADGDGTLDSTDKFPLNNAAALDTDNDGYPDSWNVACDTLCQANSGLFIDKCPTNYNPGDLSDDDQDGVGNFCEADGPGKRDPSFNTLGTNDNVSALVVQPDGKIILAGGFTSVNGVTKNNIARLNPDGSLDTSFDVGSGADSSIYGMALQTNGKVILYGVFTTINGVAHTYIARLNNDGSLDESFNPLVNDTVNSIVIQPDGKLIIAGRFTSINSVAWNRIARLNTDGSLDGTFDPGTGADYIVESLALQADGKILMGGWFVLVNGVTHNRIARLNADGSLDNTFNTSAAGYVYEMAIQPDGKVILGGTFTSINGVSRKYFARINNDGSLDTSFTPYNFATTSLKSMILQSDGRLVVGGYFSVDDQHIYRLNSDGSRDTSFNIGSTDGSVSALAVQPDGKLILGGYFSRYGGAIVNHITRIYTGDADQDQIGNAGDNCPTTTNANQLNTDGDSQGDACDTDDDNDGVADTADVFPLNAMESADADGDGTGNNADTDDDNDGAADTSDNCPLNSNADQLNTDDDAQGNTCDNDDDNDGVSDSSDAFPLHAQAATDTDGDGLPDSLLPINPGVFGDNFTGSAFQSGWTVSPTGPFYEGSPGPWYVTSGVARVDPELVAWYGNVGLSRTITMPVAGTVTFRARQATGINTCYVHFYVDGARQGGGFFPPTCSSSWAIYTYPVSAGIHTLKWENRGSSGVTAYDLDDVVVRISLLTADSDDDNDGIVDINDAFPLDASESVDTDSDGTGNNTDTDDDGDGMPDVWEIQYGLNPLANDAAGDLDGDGISNLDEYSGNTDPSVPDFSGLTNNDFNNDGTADVLLRSTSGGSWQFFSMANGVAAISNVYGAYNNTAWQLVASEDFDGDGDTDLLLRNNSTGAWRMFITQNGMYLSDANFGAYANLAWEVASIADYNGDGTKDVLLHSNGGGGWRVFYITNGTTTSNASMALYATGWDLKYDGDMDGDGDADIILRRASDGYWRQFTVQGGVVASNSATGLYQSLDWQIQFVSDLDNDGDDDIVMRSTTGNNWRTFAVSSGAVGANSKLSMYENAAWSFNHLNDVDADGDDDIVLRSNTGGWRLFITDGLNTPANSALGLYANSQWVKADVVDVNGDGTRDVILNNTSSGAWRAFMINGGVVSGDTNPGLYQNVDWTLQNK